jgi:hypothetical protein
MINLWQRCPTIMTDIMARIWLAPEHRGIAPERGEIGWRRAKKAGQPGRLRIPLLLGLVSALALLAGLAPAALASPSALPPVPSSTRTGPVPSPATGRAPDGGAVGNAPYCDRDYQRLAGDQYIAYNDDSGDYACLQTTDQQHATGFRVTTFQQDIPGGVGAFPKRIRRIRVGPAPEEFVPAGAGE